MERKLIEQLISIIHLIAPTISTRLVRIDIQYDTGRVNELNSVYLLPKCYIL